MRNLMLLTQLPFLNWTREEKDALPKLINQLNKQGTLVVLGQKRCFYCGVEVEGKPYDEIRLGNKRQVGVIVNLCDDCFLLSKKSQELS